MCGKISSEQVRMCDVYWVIKAKIVDNNIIVRIHVSMSKATPFNVYRVLECIIILLWDLCISDLTCGFVHANQLA